MSLHRSLRVDSAGAQQRTVLTRIERIKDPGGDTGLDQYNLILVNGFGERLKLKDFSLGIFLSKQLFKSLDLSAGINRTITRTLAPLGFSFWIQLKYNL